TLHNQQVTQISQVWLGENFHIQTEEIVYQRQTLELEL
ncbi:MAG: TIGR04168 family protein, partial [Cyanobacteria bacterium J083]